MKEAFKSEVITTFQESLSQFISWRPEYRNHLLDIFHERQIPLRLKRALLDYVLSVVQKEELSLKVTYHQKFFYVRVWVGANMVQHFLLDDVGYYMIGDCEPGYPSAYVPPDCNNLQESDNDYDNRRNTQSNRVGLLLSPNLKTGS